jgi:hypothetical protein
MLTWVRFLTGALAACGSNATAELRMPLNLDPAFSSLTTELCVQDVCSSDTHPLAGEVRLVLDCGTPPQQAAIQNLRLVATTQHNAQLDLGAAGDISAVLRGLIIRQLPGAQSAWSPVAGDQTVFTNIINRLSGILAYQADGLACVIVQLAGLKCDDQLDLTTRPANTIDTLPARIEISAGQVKLTGGFAFSEFIDPSQEALGRVGGKVSFVATGDWRPSLEIHPATEVIELRWCRAFSGFRLERGDSLSGAWDAVADTPELVEDHWTVSFPAAPRDTFYRLRAD